MPLLTSFQCAAWMASWWLCERMKRCPFCGKLYARGAELCADDLRPLEDLAETPGPPAKQPERSPSAFSARLVSPGMSPGMYRIYPRGDNLLFIQTEKGAGNHGWETMAGLLGPAGIMIGIFLRTWSDRKAKARQPDLDWRDAEDQLHESDDNFKLFIPDIRDAAVEPVTQTAFSGTRAGRLDFLLRDGRSLNLEFASAAEFKIALDLLTPRLKTPVRSQSARSANGGAGRRSEGLPSDERAQ